MINVDYLYNPDAAKNYLSQNRFVDQKAGFQILENVTVLPHLTEIPGIKKPSWAGFGGLVDSRGKRVAISPKTAIYKPAAVQKISEPTIFLGMFPGGWGHCITYDLSRLWFLQSADFRKEFKNCLVVCAPFFKSKLNGYDWIHTFPNFRRLLEILEVDADSVQAVTQPTQFEKLILPDSSFYERAKIGLTFTAEYRETIERIRHFAMKNRTPTSAKKIYYYHGRRQVGEERLAEYFKSKGYEIIQPEKFSVDEQLNLLINADSFASTLGSCAHNSVFLRDGAEVILIPRAPHFTGGYQQALEQVHPLNVNYVDSTLSFFSDLRSVHCYIISKQLKEFFGDDFDGYDGEDLKLFLRYVRYCLIKRYKLHPDAPAHYGDVLPTFMAQIRKCRRYIRHFKLPPDWEQQLM